MIDDPLQNSLIYSPLLQVGIMTKFGYVPNGRNMQDSEFIVKIIYSDYLTKFERIELAEKFNHPDWYNYGMQSANIRPLL